MTDFTLDPRLANDCFVLGELNSNLILLMNNSLLPWFILVPQTSEIEIIDLTASEQIKLQNSINVLGTFIKKYFTVSKLNIAAIGNIVNQLHIHIVGREPSDYCWPNVVWGTSERKSYTELNVDKITIALKEQLGTKFQSYK
ncbi:MAG: HIT domain-containing protein [Thiohalomonadales bacterium]